MRKILMIEDNTFVSDQYKSRLGGKYEVNVVPDGQSGFYAIYDMKPDAVLLDLSIPQMDAITLIGKIRAQKAFRKLPIFILADSYASVQADEAMSAGATAGFNKNDPNSVAQVQVKLHEVLAPFFMNTMGGTPSPPSSRSEAPPLPRFTPELSIPTQSAKVVQNGGAPLALQEAETASVESSSAAPALKVASPPLAAMSRHATSRVSDDSEEGFDESINELRDLFIDKMGGEAQAARKHFLNYRLATEKTAKVEAFERFRKQVGLIRTEATQCELTGLDRFLGPFEARLKQIKDPVVDLSPGCLSTLANAVDLLILLGNVPVQTKELNSFSPIALVVDDENVARRAVCFGLEKAKVKTCEASSVEAALEEAQSTPFDIIFLDVELPGMNGFALGTRIRMMPIHRNTPIIYISSIDNLSARTSTRISGGNQFLSKPVQLFELAITAMTVLIKQRIK